MYVSGGDDEEGTSIDEAGAVDAPRAVSRVEARHSGFHRSLRLRVSQNPAVFSVHGCSPAEISFSHLRLHRQSQDRIFVSGSEKLAP